MLVNKLSRPSGKAYDQPRDRKVFRWFQQSRFVLLSFLSRLVAALGKSKVTKCFRVHAIERARLVIESLLNAIFVIFLGGIMACMILPLWHDLRVI